MSRRVTTEATWTVDGRNRVDVGELAKVAPTRFRVNGEGFEWLTVSGGKDSATLNGPDGPIRSDALITVRAADLAAWGIANVEAGVKGVWPDLQQARLMNVVHELDRQRSR